MKRVCIYYCEQSNPSSLGYIRQTLEGMKDACSSIILVTAMDIPSPIKGVSVSASLQDAFSADSIQDAEEVLLLNDEWLGPVMDLHPMMDRCDESLCDAWQLAHNAAFWGLRSAALRSTTFQQWLTAPDCHLSHALQSAGLEVVTLYQTTRESTSPMLEQPLTMMQTLGCPFFLHEIFHRDYNDVIANTLGHMGHNVYRCLTESLSWNVDPLWDYLLATYHQEDLYRNMHLTYVASSHISNQAEIEEHLRTHKLALIMHLYYEELIAESLAYAKEFPPQTHITITTSSNEKRDKILQAFSAMQFASLDVRVVKNRGRDVSALLVGMADLVNKFDYFCFYHDKKTLLAKPATIGIGFAYKCTENLFKNRDFVCNVIALFRDNPRLGLLTPPNPNHANYFLAMGNVWEPNYKLSYELKEKMGLAIPMSIDKMPISPLGSCFWFRKGALTPLYNMNWKYEDFPQEPLAGDGTLSHAIERIHSMVVQAAGFYPAFLLSDDYAPIEHTNLSYYVRGFQQVCFRHNIKGTQPSMQRMLYAKLHQQAGKAPGGFRKLRYLANRLKKSKA